MRRGERKRGFFHGRGPGRGFIAGLIDKSERRQQQEEGAGTNIVELIVENSF